MSDTDSPLPYEQGQMLPNGHRVIDIDQHPSLTGFSVVLAMPNDGQPRAHSFATWSVRADGACLSGMYWRTLDEAVDCYNQRLGR